MTPSPLRVSVLVFDDADLLDIAGPYEVFAVAGRRDGLEPFQVSLVGVAPGTVALRGGVRVEPPFTVANAPAADVLIVPGGMGTRRLLQDPVLLAWLREAAGRAELVLSVCTGALLLGKAGLLDGLEVTTHQSAMALLREVAPKARVHQGERFLDNGKVIVAAGISAGIDMALHVVERLLGAELAEEAAAYMEYHWDRNDPGLQDEGV
ncbi:MAG: DJ-1/PfpI family protein [Gemmatimonadota bacterium]|nr:DJ-1/PfpI family protein [Gemmatimonadota bacterium]MDH4347403.1 DJ-1/PfpI family protein [Gemmatimonadota bacterium]MDH5282592.1 DJ-1/PfpI family protein [Gemmatimonadota bacterium]